ncbi:hypothetical protein Tco_0083287 [Tanacetum coccineum]
MASDTPLSVSVNTLVVGSSSWTPTVAGQMAIPLTVGALGSTLPIMMLVAFGARRFRSPVHFLFPRPRSIGPCHIMPFERLLLVMVVP